MSKIIFLNGCGSSSKTSIATAIQYLSDELWTSFGIDTFIDMLPFKKDDQYFTYVTGENERGSTVNVKISKKGEEFFNLMPDLAKLLADNNQNIIIDEVLHSDKRLIKYAESLKNHDCYYIGVYCDLNRMRERETLRKNRLIGLSNAQMDFVHSGIRGNYDFTIDTTIISPFDLAKQILDYVARNPNSIAFNNIKKEKK